MTEPPVIWPTRLHHLRIDSAEPDRMIPFYRDGLGLRERPLGEEAWLMDGRNRRTILFLPPKNAGRERGEGVQWSSESHEGLEELTGVDDIQSFDLLSRRMMGMVLRSPARVVYTMLSPAEGAKQSDAHVADREAGDPTEDERRSGDEGDAGEAEKDGAHIPNAQTLGDDEHGEHGHEGGVRVLDDGRIAERDVGDRVVEAHQADDAEQASQREPSPSVAARVDTEAAQPDVGDDERERRAREDDLFPRHATTAGELHQRAHEAEVERGFGHVSEADSPLVRVVCPRSVVVHSYSSSSASSAHSSRKPSSHAACRMV